MLNPGQVLTREQLLDHVWGYDFDPGSNVVDVYVGYLRKKVGAEHRDGARRGLPLQPLIADQPRTLKPASCRAAAGQHRLERVGHLVRQRAGRPDRAGGRRR